LYNQIKVIVLMIGTNNAGFVPIKG